MSLLPHITSLLAFQRSFPDEQACVEYLLAVRWPDGFACPACGVKEEPYRISTRPRVLVCRSCRVETSVTAGTVMERSHTPLYVWFWAAYLATSQTPGMSAVQLRRQLGISRCETAFMLLHKLRAGMVRPERDKIGKEWPVEVDEAYVGGRTRGEGRGVTHKALVAGAVEVRQTAARGSKRRLYAGRLRLKVVPSRKEEHLLAFLSDNVAYRSRIITDGWAGYDGLTRARYRHEPVTTDGDPAIIEKQMPMIHLVFSNLKTWLLGTHHGVSAKHLPAYLNEYVFRFNRRFYPMSAFHAVLGIASRVKGPEYEELYVGRWQHPNPREPWGGLEEPVEVVA